MGRRTFDESGDYAVRDFDLDLREHLISGTNRGIYSSSAVVLKVNLQRFISGKAYVKGYEIETISQLLLTLIKQEILIHKTIQIQDLM
ncbi:MAG: hypothetical protein CM15mV25_0180 [uncultured marine virus]|nr:MAG: hypothetical protein CM15mV25_0180 [uncultured marine virus]